MRTLTRRIVLLTGLVLLLDANVAMAAPDPVSDSATADVTVTVDEIIEWDVVVNAGNFETIELANITNQGDAPEASKSLVLYTNCNLNITADHTAAAQLTKTTDTLVTEYKLAYDKNGTNGTGGTDVAVWTDYTTFLGAGSAVTHVTLDGAVNVTLSARASNDAGNVADAGAYTATQTLTATF